MTTHPNSCFHVAYNIGDWMNCANRHPLQTFAFLPTSSQSRWRIPRFLLRGLIYDHILHSEHHEQFRFLPHVWKYCIPVSCLSKHYEKNYNYFSVIWKATFQFYSVWKQVYIFLLIKSSWLPEIAGVLLAYQDLLLL